MADDKLKENLISLKTSLGMLVSELSFYAQMLRLSESNKKVFTGDMKKNAVEVRHHVDAALELLSDIKKRLSHCIPEEDIKKNF